MTVRIHPGGVPISPQPYRELEDQALEWISGNRLRTIVTMSFPMLGPYFNRDDYRAAINGGDIILPDGMTMVWIARRCGYRIPERLSGPDFFVRFSAAADREKLRYCLMGSTSPVLEKMRRRLAREFPGIVVADTISPPFGAWSPETESRLVSRINASQADVLWLGVTAPRQEIWLHRQGERLNVPLAAAIGAGFDFFAGTRRRAPAWMRRSGLEWLHRVAREPLRMLPRYLRSVPAVTRMILACRRGDDA